MTLRRDRHGNVPLLLGVVVAAIVIAVAVASLALGFSGGSFAPGGCVASGRVSDGNGAALQGALIEVRTTHFPAGPEAGFYTVTDSARSGLLGDYRVSVPCPSSSRLLVRADGFSPRSVQLPANVNSGAWTYDFVMYRTAE